MSQIYSHTHSTQILTPLDIVLAMISFEINTLGSKKWLGHCEAFIQKVQRNEFFEKFFF